MQGMREDGSGFAFRWGHFKTPPLSALLINLIGRAFKKDGRG